MRILIADDDSVSRRVLEAMLLKWGHEVVAVCDGTQAWQVVQKPDAPDLMVLDWMMPGMDGVEICRRARELVREIRPYIILLTARQQSKDLVNGIMAGADDYVIKPFEAEELKVRIHAGERILNLQIESLAVKEALRRQATHDALTGLLNRQAILEMVERELDRSRRTGAPVGIVMADIDHFKSINDTYGHQVGDDVLAEVASRMAGEIRPYEGLGRYGGEEYVAVLSGADPEGVRAMAERLRQTVAASEFAIPSGSIPVTLSLGAVSSMQVEQPTLGLLVRMADAALYRAKHAGRNRVELADASFGDSQIICSPSFQVVASSPSAIS
jgi:two-component system, cell cycle response regulator